MAKVFVVVGFVCALFQAHALNAAIINGSFETGDTSGWTSSDSSLVEVISSVAHIDDLGAPGTDIGTWTPTNGNFFARLLAGTDVGVYTMLSQSFVASSGDVLSLDVFFDAGDYLPFNDDGFVSILDSSSNVVAVLYSNDVSTVGDYGFDGWRSVSHTFTASGTFVVQGGVTNIDDNSFPSALGLDNVVLTTAVPEPISFLAWSLGGIGLCCSSLRRRK